MRVTSCVQFSRERDGESEGGAEEARDVMRLKSLWHCTRSRLNCQCMRVRTDRGLHHTEGSSSYRGVFIIQRGLHTACGGVFR